jgi:hypothetical protein
MNLPSPEHSAAPRHKRGKLFLPDALPAAPTAATHEPGVELSGNVNFPAPGSTPPDRFVAWAARLELSLLRQSLIVGVLSFFIMFGLFLANYSLSWADWYWSAMFPLFGLVCLGHQLTAGDTHGMSAAKVLLRQALHWLGPIVAVRIIFLQLAKGEMDADAVALMILLVLSVTCFLAGLHFDYSFIWLSAFLALVALMGTELEAYFWLIVVVGLLAAALVILSAALIRRRKYAPATQARLSHF